MSKELLIKDILPELEKADDVAAKVVDVRTRQPVASEHGFWVVPQNIGLTAATMTMMVSPGFIGEYHGSPLPPMNAQMLAQQNISNAAIQQLHQAQNALNSGFGSLGYSLRSIFGQ